MASTTTTRPDYVQYGCGLCAPESWTNFDASPTLRAQRAPVLGVLGRRLGPAFPANARYGDIVRGLPVAPRSCTAVYCSHVLEHLALDDFHTALKNTLGYLKPGGTFRFVLPDLEQLARDYLASPSPQAALRFMEDSYLGVKSRPRGLRALVRGAMGNSLHLWMWDFRSMSDALARVGFVDIRRAQFGDSPDPMFREVEDPGRWNGQLGVECRAPGA